MRRVTDVFREPLDSVTWMWSPFPLREGVRRTRTLGLRSVFEVAPEADDLPPSKYSMSSRR
jgi:hypothetical protein